MNISTGCQENGYYPLIQNLKNIKQKHYQEKTQILDRSNFQKQVQVKRHASKNQQLKQTNKNDLFSQNMPHIHLLSQIIQTIENNQTRKCKYLLFHVPFTLAISHLLQIHPSPRTLLVFQILKQELRYINELMRKEPGQMSEMKVKNIMGEIICFQQMPKGHFLERLKIFLIENQAKMSTFMPYYYHIFLFVTESKGIKTTVQIDTLYRAKVKEIRSKYHNNDI